MKDISFSSLAMPLLAGPGVPSPRLSGSPPSSPSSTQSYRVVSIGILVTSTLSWLMLRESALLLKFLGVNGANALTKIMGFLLLCIGVQLAIDGLLQVFK